MLGFAVLRDSVCAYVYVLCITEFHTEPFWKTTVVKSGQKYEKVNHLSLIRIILAGHSETGQYANK